MQSQYCESYSEPSLKVCSVVKKVSAKRSVKPKTIAPVVEEKVVDTLVPDSLIANATDALVENATDTLVKEEIKKTVLSHLNDFVEEPFHLLESYFEGKHLDRLVRHQIESYNHFINYQIHRTIQMFNPLVIHSENDFVPEKQKYFLEIVIYFENLKIHQPQIHENNGATKNMFPQEARLRNFTYASNMTIDLNIKYIIRDTEDMETPKIIEKVLPKINIGKMPILLKSSICLLNDPKNKNNRDECALDCGGYFIIKGSEKTVLGQERAAENRIYCFYGKNTTKWNWYAEIKSVPDFKCISPKQVEMMIANKNNGFGNGIYIQIPRVKQPIELFVLFRAMGIMADKKISEYIVLDIANEKTREILEFLKASVMDGNKYMTKEDALKHITCYVAFTPPMNMDKETGIKKKRDFTLEVLANDLFPHCQSVEQKLYLIGYMAKKLIETAKGWRLPDDRDSYVNKRIELTGTLMNNLFRNYFNKLTKETQKLTVREINSHNSRSLEDYENILNMTNIYKLVKSATIENGLNRALSTGDFSIKQANSSKVGVGQVLNRLTYPATLSHLRRINTPLEKSGELIAPRKLHNTTWGFLCPVETPEGQSIGIVKSIAYMTHITIPINSKSIYDCVLPQIHKIEEVSSLFLSNKVKVFINGSWVGVTTQPLELFADLKEKKYCGIINIYTSIVFDYKNMEIRVCSDGGRLTRPLLRVKDGKALLTMDVVEKVKEKKLLWNDLLTQCHLPDSVIEYIDVEEQGHSMVALKEKNNISYKNAAFNYTHCEIHPSTIFGVLASCVPFPEHNQAPRNTYECAQLKQAIGIYALNFDKRMDKTAYVMTYPSRPLVDTRLMNYIHIHKAPSGCQIHVAIMSHTGYNQEDSLLINKGSLDRGMFMSTIYHTEKDEDKNIIRDEIIRCKPDKLKTKGVKFGNYEKLNANGFIPENTKVENRDVIIAKIIPIKKNRNVLTEVIKYEDQSRIYRTTEESYIDKNYTGRNGDGYNFAKTRVRILRKPVIGDKFSSRMGQKGTCGNIIPECDMPFTKDGLRPDLILNPHAIPSRMTIGQLKETVLGKVLIELGIMGDGTAFGSLDVQTICEELQKNGFHSKGDEVMYDGLTGEQMQMSIFIGPVYYQRLKHMVNDKQHSRAFGPMVNLTRQPAEGRSRDGGFRVGEMERDVLLAHGMSRFTKERLYDVSDAYSAFVCKKCGMIAAYNNGDNKRINKLNDNYTIHNCNTCDNMTEFAKVDIPYAFKLLSQELQTINIVPRLITE